MRPWRLRPRALLAALALLLTAACGSPPSANDPSGNAAVGPSVVASTSVLADLVQQVGGARLRSARSVVPAGVDVEDYDPRPEDLKAVAQADLLVMNGLALDRWVPRLVESAHPGMPTLVLSDGLPVLGVGTSADEDIAQHGNPHLWLDPHYTKAYVQKVRDRLVTVDPAGRAAYEASTSAYLAELDELDGWIRQQVASIPPENRKLVTFHEAYPYFGARYGFQLVGVITPSPGQEPSAGELSRLVQTVRAANVKAVFSEAQFSPKLAQTLAQEAGVQQVVSDLYNDSLGDPPADSYIGMMHYNVERIVQALR